MDDLYRENILEHYKRPHNWSPPEPELDRVDLQFHDLNPLCGDELTVKLAVDADQRIEGIRFEGHGCAISQAAASMASDEITGMTVSEVLSLDRSFVLDLLGHRHLRAADEVRPAVAQGAQERLAGPGRGLGARDAGLQRPGRRRRLTSRR